MNSELLSILGTLALGFAALYFLLKRHLATQQNPQQLEQLINQVFGMSAEKIAQQSQQVLAQDKELIRSDLEHKHQALEKMMTQMREELRQRQDEVRLLEKDRLKQFSELHTTIEQHRVLTDKLHLSTRQLAEVLSNNQLRGGWGERIIEDLLRANGLVEGVHYVRQTVLVGSTLRPDISLLLPNKRVVAVDVKFPYAEIQKMALAEGKPQQKAHLQQFRLDIKTKVKKVAEYISPEGQTLDYAILFVPNEMVFSFINQQLPDVIDEALSQRVMIVSPFTFLIVARTVMESYRNFMIGDTLREVVTSVDEFVVEWDKFKTQFGKYGRTLQTLVNDYEQLTTTRVKQMERKVEKVQLQKQGTLLPEQPVLIQAETLDDEH